MIYLLPIVAFGALLLKIYIVSVLAIVVWCVIISI